MAASATLLTVIQIICWDPADDGVGAVASVSAQLGKIGISTGHSASTASDVQGSDPGGL